MAPLGLGDELRAALIAKKECWGVLCLHRENATHGFDAREVDLIRRISPHVAEGLRRAIIVRPAEPAGRPHSSELPLAVYAAAARLTRQETDLAAPQPEATARLRTRAGRWLSLHASRLNGPAGPQIGIVIESAPATHVSSLLLSAYGLTEAQSRVTALVIKGHSTRQIVEEFGVRSRRELVAAVLTGKR
jgi:hypothetical protein